MTFDPLDGDYGHTQPFRLPPWWKHPFVILGGAALLAYVIAGLVLRALVDADMVRDWVTPRASAALNRPVRIGEGTLGIFPRPSVHLSSIEIENGTGSEGSTLARVDQVRLDLAWLPLLIGRIRVHGVEVDGAVAHLAIDESGRSNFGDLVPRRAAADDPGSPPFAAELRRVRVSDASLSYFDARGGRSMAITGGDASIDIHDQPGEGESGWRATAALGSDSLVLRYAGPTEEIFRVGGPRGQLSARGGTDQRTVEIESGFVVLATDTLDVWAIIADLAEPQPSFEIELTDDDMSPRTLATLLPADLRASLPALDGEGLAVELRLSSGLARSDGPSVETSVRVQGVTLRAPDEPVTEGNDGVQVEPNGAGAGR